MEKECKNEQAKAGVLDHFFKFYPVDMPYFESIKFQMETWIRRNNLLEANDFQKEEAKLNSLYKFAPRLFPYANPRVQILASKLFFLLFLMDDKADHYQGNYWSDLWEYHISSRSHKEYKQPDLIKIALDIIDLLKMCESTGRKPELLKYFMEFIHAGTQERSKWMDSDFPQLSDYLEFNRKSSGVGMAFEIMEIAHPDLKYTLTSNFSSKMKALIADLIILSNDLDSYNKENREKDLNNLVILFKYKKGLSWKDSHAAVKKILSDKLQTTDLLFKKYLLDKEVSYALFLDIECSSLADQEPFAKLFNLYLGCKYWAKNDSVRYH